MLARSLLYAALMVAATAMQQSALAKPQKSSPLIIDESTQTLINVNLHTNSVSRVSLGASTLSEETIVGAAPQGASLSTDHQRLFITNRDDSTVSIVDMDSFKQRACFDVGAQPHGLVVDEQFMYVANQNSDTVSVVSQSILKPMLEIAVDRAPKGLTIDTENNRLYVTHFFSGSVTVINTASLRVIETIGNISTANVSQSFVINADRSAAFMPHTLSNAGNKALIFDNTVFPVISKVDLASSINSSRNRMFIDIVDRPVGLPIDIELSSDGILYVANAASNDISVIDSNTGSAIGHIQIGANPRGLKLSDDELRLYVSNALDGNISVIDTVTLTTVDTISVTAIDYEDPIYRGKMLFNSSDDTRLARDQWIACSTCHFDAEHDRRTWFFGDGIRNTPSLLGLSATRPFHWSGDLDELQDVEITIRDIQAGTGLADGGSNCEPTCDTAAPNRGRSSDLDALASYLNSLQPLQQSRELSSEDAAFYSAGNSVFSSAETGCATCHYGPSFTDGLNHDVGTGRGTFEFKGTSFNTPTLLNLANSAPYLHDGSEDSLFDLLTNPDLHGKHGNTSQLNGSELESLVFFLKNLSSKEAAEIADNQCTRPSIENPMVTSAGDMLFTMNAEVFRVGDAIDIKAYVAGFRETDLYFVVEFPDGMFQSFLDEASFGQKNELAPFAIARNLETSMAAQLLDSILPAGLPIGTYSLHGLMTPPGSDPLNTEHWIKYQKIEFRIDSN